MNAVLAQDLVICLVGSAWFVVPLAGSMSRPDPARLPLLLRAIHFPFRPLSTRSRDEYAVPANIHSPVALLVWRGLLAFTVLGLQIAVLRIGLDPQFTSEWGDAARFGATVELVAFLAWAAVVVRAFARAAAARIEVR